jgi:hypothetical protein
MRHHEEISWAPIWFAVLILLLMGIAAFIFGCSTIDLKRTNEPKRKTCKKSCDDDPLSECDIPCEDKK